MSDHKYEKWIQKDDVVIDGIDISGEWNKMYEPREILDYDITGLERVPIFPAHHPSIGVTNAPSVLGFAPLIMWAVMVREKFSGNYKRVWTCSPMMICGCVRPVPTACGSVLKKWI